ncbi:hypothetical protein [Paenibacillus graminis]
MHRDPCLYRRKICRGQAITPDAPLEQIPLFFRDDAALPVPGEHV